MKPFPLLGHLPQFLPDKLGFLLRAATGATDVVELRIGTRTYLLTNPEDIKHVLLTNQGSYAKSPRLTGRRGKRLFGEGLIVSAGPAHLRKRQMLQPVFHRKVIAEFATVMLGATERMLADWQDGATLDMGSEMLKLARNIMVETLFGPDQKSAAGELAEALDIRRRYIEYAFRSLFPFPEYLPTRINRQYRHAARRLDTIISERIGSERAAVTPSGNMLSLLIQARHDDGASLNDEEVRDEVLTLSLAGYETIGQALAWTWYLLANHAREEAQLLTELAEVLDGRPPCLSDVPKLRYTAMVLAESMRLYPPTWLFVRIARDDDRLPSGVPIPAGAKVFLSPYASHRDPRYFPNPDVFDPERFTDEAKRSRPKYAYFPFGGGPRVCIGEAFATMEGVLLVARIAQRFTCELVGGQTIIPEPGITLRPKNGMAMRIHRRST